VDNSFLSFRIKGLRGSHSKNQNDLQNHFVFIINDLQNSKMTTKMTTALNIGSYPQNVTRYSKKLTKS
jgi:hypothetical protein